MSLAGRRAAPSSGGEQIAADLVVMAVGIRPTLSSPQSQVRREPAPRRHSGHDTLQTLTDPRIYSVGECANHRGMAYGLVAPLFERA